MHALDLLRNERKAGEKTGIYSICSAHELAVEAAAEQAQTDSTPLCIESTPNQVNQFGGYTGLTPALFMAKVFAIADATGLPKDRLIFGGDHLGPFPWRAEQETAAMAKSAELVRTCVKAGYTKIHIDTSMYLKSDQAREGKPLDPETVAERSAALCQVAENIEGAKPVYILGTEVPTPGGVSTEDEPPVPTAPDELWENIGIFEKVFKQKDLEEAWNRVVGIVVQPGIEFGNEVVHEYDRNQADKLVEAINSQTRFLFEGHSTDYQQRESLRQLVVDGISILKVGPALTFAMREALFLLSLIEEELYRAGLLFLVSGLRDEIDTLMLTEPIHWNNHYSGNDKLVRFQRTYSYSDRIRYYWSGEPVKRALAVLFTNLSKTDIPLSLISQFFPLQYAQVRAKGRPPSPRAIVLNHIRYILADYAYAIRG